MSDALSFDQILQTVSDADMMKPYPAKSPDQLRRDNLKDISPETQRFYLAFYARAAFEHVGFDGFSAENQSRFKSEIEQMYADATTPRKQGNFLTEMADRTARCVEDRHFEIETGEKKSMAATPPIPAVSAATFFTIKTNPNLTTLWGKAGPKNSVKNSRLGQSAQ